MDALIDCDIIISYKHYDKCYDILLNIIEMIEDYPNILQESYHLFHISNIVNQAINEIPNICVVESFMNIIEKYGYNNSIGAFQFPINTIELKNNIEDLMKRLYSFE